MSEKKLDVIYSEGYRDGYAAAQANSGSASVLKLHAAAALVLVVLAAVALIERTAFTAEDTRRVLDAVKRYHQCTDHACPANQVTIPASSHIKWTLKNDTASHAVVFFTDVTESRGRHWVNIHGRAVEVPRE